METRSGSFIEESVRQLSDTGKKESRFLFQEEIQLPSIDRLKEAVELLRSIIFPGYFGEPASARSSLPYFLGVRVEKLYGILAEQIRNVRHFNSIVNRIGLPDESAEETARRFIETLPELRRILCTDVEAIYNGDPAAKSHGEIVFCYPSIRAMINHRAAHTLIRLDVPLIPRIISEMSHSETGIDIHPGASIGEHFCIDHGTGVVIGETCIIGNNVRIYQGVTLGAKKFELDKDGNPAKNIPRHPVIEDNVVIYSNANILGRITIGKNSVIGGSVWITRDVPSHSRILQQKAVESSFTDGLGI